MLWFFKPKKYTQQYTQQYTHYEKYLFFVFLKKVFKCTINSVYKAFKTCLKPCKVLVFIGFKPFFIFVWYIDIIKGLS